MRRTTSRIVAVATAGALSFALAGCGDDGEKKESTSSSSEQKTDAPEATETPDASETPDATETPEPSEAPEATGDALAKVVAQANDQLGSVKDAMKDTYSDIVVEGKGENELVYRYVYKTKVPVEESKAALEQSSETLRTTSENTIIPSLETAGIKDPKVTYLYENPNGETIYEVSFTK